MSAPTPARAPAARPHRPPYRPRRESPVRAHHPQAWECTPGGSLQGDTFRPSRSACNPGRTAGHCSHSASIVCPSGPGAPFFDATFNSALVNRLATSSIVAGAAISSLPIACGAPARTVPKPVPGSPTGGPLRVFCCRDQQAELHRRFFDRDRLPLPAGARPGTLSGHYPAFRYYSVLGLLLGHQPSSSRSPAYRQTSPEPSRSPGVRC